MGHGAEGAGLDAGDVPVTATAVLDAAATSEVPVAVALHLVQMVETEVRVTVETVLEVVR